MIGLNIHQAKISACAVNEQSDGTVVMEMQEFGGFKRDRPALAQWAESFDPEIVVMESTGIYWKSPYATLEGVGIAARVVNARHVKTVPGRKTDVADAQWLATLARAGLLRGSFIPHQHTSASDLAVDYEALSVQKNAPIWLKMLKKYGFLPANETIAPTSAAFAV